MKLGIELRIDVTKIDKARIYNGAKGKYLTMTAFVDVDQKDQYDNNGMITHKKEEGEERAPILGNTKVFWTDSQQARQQPQHTQQGGFEEPQSPGVRPNLHNQGSEEFEDQIPF